ncbi:MAG: hypothetical protein AAGF87_09815 [Bacteroidota bacterium]
MRHFFLAALLSCTLATSVQAQATNYGAFEWDIVRLGYAIPGGVDGVTGGLLLGTEPRYNINDQISASLRIEIAVYGSDLEGDNVDIGAAGSYTLFGDYYFDTEKTTRLFGGLGIGLFSGASVSVGDVTADAANTIGVVPRVGVELGHFRVALEYNLAFDEAVANYIGLAFAGTIGGGPR